MKKLSLTLVTSALLALSAAGTLQATPAEDQEALKGYFSKKFSKIDLDKYGDGAYIYREDAYEQFQAMEEDFPPYELSLIHI